MLRVLAPREAAELHLACVRDTTRVVASVGGYRKWLLVASRFDAARKLARQAGLSSRWCLGVQVGRDLGERLAFAFNAALTAGVEKVVVVGTDTPWISPQRIVRAFALLDRADVVLGPTADGGYYLVAARRLVPQMFRGIRWGTSRVFAQTKAALRKAGASVRLLPRDFDLDRPADLRRVARLLRKKSIRAPSLKRWLVGWELPA
jgi:rSAM/selenodomain-associated transferase 1